ncbi:MAG: hypothetical protein HYV60_22085 [Planctomycetia bacterium]|nr:hypothetical protein [Planctomycetia bacterium]
MTEQFSTPSAMYADHRYWKQEHSAWRGDIALWQEEYDALRAALKELEQAVQRHGEALQEHATAITEHEAALDLHERVIAEYEAGCERPGRDDTDIDRHQQQAFAHFDQRQTHERMKREHHRLVAQLEMIDSILSE